MTMSKPAQTQDARGPSRRTLLQAGGAASGSLLLGFHATAAAAAAAPVNGQFAPNAFIRINNQGVVTLIMSQQEMGQGIYTALSQLLADELDADFSKVRFEASPPDDMLYGSPRSHRQSTGGSTSIVNFYTHLRKAGAAGRAMLVQAAASGWKVDPATCRTANGVVYHDASQRQAAYGALAARAGRLKAPADPPLKAEKDLKLIGKPVKRLDTPDKVNGKAVYGIDVMAGKVKVATMRASPVVGGKVRSVDDSRAKLIPGVRQIVVLDDMVAVVGDNMWVAKKGLDALGIVWNDGPNAKINSAQLLRDLRRASQRKGAVAEKAGDPDKALAKNIYQTAYETQNLSHAPMEPLNATVHVTPGGCEIWMGTQVQTRAQATAAKELGIPQDKVILHNHMLGGAFGRRLDVDMVTKAVRIAKQVDGPVKVVWTREEDTRQDMYRPARRNIMKGSVENGRITGWVHHITSPSVQVRMSGRQPKDGVDGGSIDGATELVYDIPNWRVEFVHHESPGVNVGYWRGVGPNNTVFAIESFVDELAKRARKDPVQFRLGMLGKNPRMAACLKLAAAKSNWGAQLGRRVGQGVSIQHVFGSYIATVAEVEVDGDGQVKVRRYTSAIDCGSVVNPDIVKQQVEGGLLFGLTAALYGDITFENGRVQQSNFHDYRALRINETPQIEVHLIRNNEKPGGVGEPGVTCAAPSLLNAIDDSTGIRLRRLPIDRDILAGRKKA
jgi:isoquinoline 1-oxidoreductase beta subunit